MISAKVLKWLTGHQSLYIATETATSILLLMVSEVTGLLSVLVVWAYGGNWRVSCNAYRLLHLMMPWLWTSYVCVGVVHVYA